MPPPQSQPLLYQDDNNDPHQSITSFLPTSHIHSTSASVSLSSEPAHFRIVTSGGTLDLSHDADIFEVRHGMSSTSKGILIGMLSAFGSALLIAIILALVYFFRYTSRGRIFLDSIGRPGEYDDEQAFAQEEAEAVEEMDDIQRAEYLRAKSEHLLNDSAGSTMLTPLRQSLFNQTHPNPSRRTSHSHNSLPYRRKAYLRGSLSPSWRYPIASLKAGPKLSFLTLKALFRPTYPCPSKMRSTTGRLRSTISPSLRQ